MIFRMVFFLVYVAAKIEITAIEITVNTVIRKEYLIV